MIDDLEKLIRLFLKIIADRLKFAQGNGSQEIETSCEPFYYCDASEFFTLHSQLYECCNDFLTGSWQHIDNWNLWHGVATWLQTE